MPENKIKLDRLLIRVVQAASALSLGTLAGLLYSVKAVVPSIRFQVSGATFLAAGLAAAGSVAFWHVTFKLNASAQHGNVDAQGKRVESQQKTRLAFLSFILGAALVGAFAYPLKDFSRDKVFEIAFGAAIAVAFLTTLGLLFWKVVRFFEADQSALK